MKKLFTVFVVFMMLAFSACSVEKEILITSQNSPDNEHTVYLYQVGSPQWSFGSVNAKLVLENSSGKMVDEKEFALANDGAGVFEGNIKEITWLENQVEIIMDEADTTRQYTYILNYSE
ncbi:MAG: hypothetical protein IJ333_02845 [Clostridia bacterium]|nr:hypothetical protein [Clostridia bacterium]